MSDMFTCEFCGERGFGYTIKLCAHYFGQSLEAPKADVRMCADCRNQKIKAAMAIFQGKGGMLK